MAVIDKSYNRKRPKHKSECTIGSLITHKHKIGHSVP